MIYYGYEVSNKLNNFAWRTEIYKYKVVLLALRKPDIQAGANLPNTSLKLISLNIQSLNRFIFTEQYWQTRGCPHALILATKKQQCWNMNRKKVGEPRFDCTQLEANVSSSAADEDICICKK